MRTVEYVVWRNGVKIYCQDIKQGFYQIHQEIRDEKCISEIYKNGQVIKTIEGDTCDWIYKNKILEEIL